MPPPSSNPQALVTNRFGDRYFYDVNRKTFDKIGASAVFSQHFGGLFSTEDALFVIIGTDSGLLPQWIAQQGPAAGTRYLFVEPDDIADRLEVGGPCQALGEQFAVCTPQQWQQTTERFCFDDYAYLGRIQVVQSIGAADAYVGEYHDINKKIGQQVETACRYIQINLGNQVYIQRQIENIADNVFPAVALVDSQPGRTAVVLGGGPSLDDIIPWLQQYRERLVVFAVSRIARQLLSHGLQPDFVASIDPHPESFDVSKEMLRFDENCVLINSYHVSPPLLAQWRGAALYRGPRYPWDSKYEVDNLPNIGPTVTNMALDTAIDMGFSRIVLGGVDLCFSADGRTHASGSHEAAAGPRLGDTGPQVTTNDGQLADTDYAFAQAVDIMGRQAEKASAKGCSVVNYSAGAARIPHVTFVPLDELDAPDEPADTAAIREQLQSHTQEKRRAALKQASEELGRARGKLRKIEDMSGRAITYNEKLFGTADRAGDFSYKARMDDIERKFDHELKVISRTVKAFGTSLFMRLVRTDKDREWTDEKLKATGRQYYEAYQSSAQALIKLIETAQSRIRARLSECDDTPDIAYLLDHWRRDDTPGRGAVFAARQPAVYSRIGAQHAAQFAELHEEFQRRLDQQQIRHAATITARHSLSLVRGKLANLFGLRDQPGLSRLYQELGKQSSAEAVELHALALGYLAELQDNPDVALASYQALANRAIGELDDAGHLDDNPRLEDALQRMCVIALQRQDADTALMALDALAALSPVYEPRYADMLRLAGRIQDAVNVYVAYLEKTPEDLSAMLKLGQLFQQAGVVESARWAYGHVLEQEPDNRAAQQLLASLATPTGSA